MKTTNFGNKTNPSIGSCNEELYTEEQAIKRVERSEYIQVVEYIQFVFIRNFEKEKKRISRKPKLKRKKIKNTLVTRL